ncbi:MAG: hydrogenase/urease maturation nickel metallochaperone HypA, partial [Bulleidia sp.]
MHELGVTFHIMDHVEKVAEENGVTRIHTVTLELGEVSTVIESYLQSCW